MTASTQQKTVDISTPKPIRRFAIGKRVLYLIFAISIGVLCMHMYSQLNSGLMELQRTVGFEVELDDSGVYSTKCYIDFRAGLFVETIEIIKTIQIFKIMEINRTRSSSCYVLDLPYITIILPVYNNISWISVQRVEISSLTAPPP